MAVYDFFTYDRLSGTMAPQDFEVFSYPMGDVTIRKTPNGIRVNKSVQGLRVTGTAVDWTVVSAWSAACAHFFPTARRVLVLPYLPSARGDKDIPSPARINAEAAARTGITDLITVDPHSSVWLKAFEEAAPFSTEIHLLDAADIACTAVSRNASRENTAPYTAVIAPDQGAEKRAGRVAEYLHVPLITAVKKRDHDTGRLISYSLPVQTLPGERFLVVDDICDGGATFGLLAASVEREVSLDLWVTHGGFTKGTRGPLSRYQGIYTSDSLPMPEPFPRNAHGEVQVIRLHEFIMTALRDVAAL